MAGSSVWGVGATLIQILPTDIARDSLPIQPFRTGQMPDRVMRHLSSPYISLFQTSPTLNGSRHPTSGILFRRNFGQMRFRPELGTLELRHEWSRE